ncbi:hypothetical protein Nepgr_022249 [Nepenthes gracilis]|uniref:RING-type domain-containing protein n=1 Tax=Nepenthes gracilis TaxID=150966 RepID=A0AAD3SZZ6_NEPGR|nr:hypothetical protein Nepgr_022249 [Nepenthes gracilis]
MESSTHQTMLTTRHFTLRESFLASDIAENDEISGNNDNGPDITNSLSGLTLAAVLRNERGSHFDINSTSNNSNVVRSLLDIVRNEETLSNTNNDYAGRKSWKSFRDCLKLKRLATVSHLATSVPVSQSDLDISNNRSQMLNRNCIRNSLGNTSIGRPGCFDATPAMETFPADDIALRGSSTAENGNSLEGGGDGSMRLAAALAAEREETRRRLSMDLLQDEDLEEIVGATGDVEGGGELEVAGGAILEAVAPPAQQLLRMSLMDLLEETDRQAGFQQPSHLLDDDDDGEKEEEQGEADELKGGDGVSRQKGQHSCCVCMVRHKGAAFIPCGHTFCRLCSRELWVQRGNCPLCNGFILEILDIF